MYSALVIVSARCPCQPPPRFDATGTVFTLTNRCKCISTSLVSYSLIFGSIGVGKSLSTPSALIVAPAITTPTMGGIDGRFIPWDKSSNLLKR